MLLVRAKYDSKPFARAGTDTTHARSDIETQALDENISIRRNDRNVLKPNIFELNNPASAFEDYSAHINRIRT
jgi:hypothetical protein